jgi:hypothetical protein
MEIKISFTPGDKGRDAICGCQQAKNAAIHPRSAPEWALVGAIGSFAGRRDWVQTVALAQLGITNGEPSTGARLPKESPIVGLVLPLPSRFCVLRLRLEP